jgi:two-component SAPR family response regulator
LDRKEEEMITAQEMAQRDKAEEDVKAWLQAKSTLELYQFLTSPWVASLLSDEAIEELYQELEQREASPLEVGLDSRPPGRPGSC